MKILRKLINTSDKYSKWRDERLNEELEDKTDEKLLIKIMGSVIKLSS